MEAEFKLHPITLRFRDPVLEEGYRHEWTQRMLTSVRTLIGLAIVIYLQNYLTLWLMAPEAYRPLAGLNTVALVLVLLLLAGTWQPRLQRRLRDVLFCHTLVIVMGIPLLNFSYLPSGMLLSIGGEAMFLGLIVIYVIPLGFFRGCLANLSYSASLLLFLHARGLIGEEFQSLTLLYCIGSMTLTLSGYLNERRDRLRFFNGELLARERERSEHLLLNILPSPIARRLKQREDIIADGFGEVGVLFSDIVGFTRMSARLSAQEVVWRLNQLFVRFDELVERHRLEKIKTIGDAYMIASGLPEPNGDHLERLAEMALDMRDAMASYSSQVGEPMGVRIGMHFGPVVAGVIGKRKFAYDLWGDTVNTASRMESHGLPGAIQVTAEVAEKLGDRYQFERRGVIAVKGKGELETWILVGRRTETATAEADATAG